MSDKKTVPLEDALKQVSATVTRIALIHLGFSKVLVSELGEEKAKELIIKSMVEYGKLVGKHCKSGGQDLPHYGFHDKYSYKNKDYIDTREPPTAEAEQFDFSEYKAFGCGLAKTFQQLGEEELGRLYCYVDSAKSMAADPNHKLIHTDCMLCGDEYCAFDVDPTTEKERDDFEKNTKDWKHVDPILMTSEES